MSNYRQTIVTLADDFLAGKINHQQFRDTLPDYPWEDRQVDELVDMITHEPKVGGFLGVSKAQGEKNRAEIIERLEELRQSLSQPAV